MSHASSIPEYALRHVVGGPVKPRPVADVVERARVAQQSAPKAQPPGPELDRHPRCPQCPQCQSAAYREMDGGRPYSRPTGRIGCCWCGCVSSKGAVVAHVQAFGGLR